VKRHDRDRNRALTEVETFTVFQPLIQRQPPNRLKLGRRYGEVFGNQDGGESWLEMPLPPGVQHIYALACG
jgi:hypothetical protein